jgi:hypothetical protein
MKSQATKKVRPKGTKPIKKVPNLDILAMAERISHLEQVVGELVYLIRILGKDIPDIRHSLKNALIDLQTKRLI